MQSRVFERKVMGDSKDWIAFINRVESQNNAEIFC